MNRIAHTLLVFLMLAMMLVACSQGVPEPTPGPTLFPEVAATSTPTPSPTLTSTALPTIVLPITSTLPPVTLPLPATIAPTVCAPRAEWTGSHIIQSGDSLFIISQSYGLSILELQLANCIDDANFIQAGQVLRVPGSGETPTPTATEANLPVGTSTPLIFSADNNVLVAGECTLLRWEIDNINAVFFDGTSVSGRGFREVCPEQTTRYTLLVLYTNGEQVPHIVVVEVRPA